MVTADGPEALAGEFPAPVRRTESHFAGQGGVRLFRRSWLPPEPRWAIALVHGYAEHSGRYEELGAWLARRGIAVHAYDHRGHGLSQGRRCHVSHFGELVEDLGRHVEQVREQHPGLPLTVLGHSLGGLVVLTFLVTCQPRLASAVVSGPALVVHMSPLRRRLAALMARIWPTLSVASGLDASGISRDPEVVRRYLDDPLVESTATASFGLEMVRAAETTARRGAEVRVPLLMLHGEEDPLCSVEGSRRFFAEVTAGGSVLHTYPGLRHEIFNEPEHLQVFQDLLDWLQERAA